MLVPGGVGCVASIVGDEVLVRLESGGEVLALASEVSIAPRLVVCAWALDGCLMPRAKAPAGRAKNDGICAPCRRKVFGR